jgi:HopA1 effector protein family
MNRNGTQHEAIKKVLSTISIDSPEQFSLGGRAFPVHTMGAHLHHHTNGHRAAEPIVATLTTYLYEFAYSRTFRNPLPEAEARDLSPDVNLVEAMSAANATSDRWEHGWFISEISHHGPITAQKGNQQRSIWPGQFLSKDGPAAVTRVGAEISIFYAKESRSLQPGFYYAFGETPEETRQSYGLTRLYWNLSPEGAPRLINLLTTRLNRFQVPFRFKCVTAQGQFERTDCAVLYLAKRYFRITAELMLDVHPGIADYLDDDVPLFSKKLARGLSVAEDPGTGESFGQSRSQCLAQSAWNCYLNKQVSLQARLKEFRRLLSERGIDPELPHLNKGSLDWYDLPAEAA